MERLGSAGTVSPSREVASWTKGTGVSKTLEVVVSLCKGPEQEGVEPPCRGVITGQLEG